MNTGATQEQSPSADWIRNISSSKFNYWAGYAANLSLVAWLLSRALGSEMSFGRFLFSAVLGLFVWTFAEYLLHRYVYHEVPSVFVTGHDLHHQEPKALLGVPWYLTAVVLIALYYGIAYFLDPARTGVVMGFAWLGYIGYCFVHHSIHHWNFKNPVFRHLHRHHMIHHYHTDRNWGMVTDFWDIVFRTKHRA